MSELLPFASLQKIMKIYQFPLINNSKQQKLNRQDKQDTTLPQLSHHKIHQQNSKKHLKYHRVKTELQANNQQDMQLQQRPIFNIVKNGSPQQLQKQLTKLQRRRQFSQKVIKPSISSTKIQTYTEAQIRQDKLKHPYKYQILSDENGFSDEKVYKMKNHELNFQLEQFTKDKGKQYFQNMAYELRSENKNSKAKSTVKTSIDQSSHELSKRYPNYIPQVFAELKHKKRKEKKIEQKKQRRKQPVPVINQKLLKLRQLSQKEEMLGKVVLDEVKKHFNDEKKQQNKYFSRVKSEEHIDDALIEFLKTKIDRAQVQLT